MQSCTTNPFFSCCYCFCEGIVFCCILVEFFLLFLSRGCPTKWPHFSFLSAIFLSIYLFFFLDLVSICYIARLVYFHNCYAFFILFHIFLWMDFMINGLACLGTSLFSVCARLRKRNASFTIFVIVLLFFGNILLILGKMNSDTWDFGWTWRVNLWNCQFLRLHLNSIIVIISTAFIAIWQCQHGY